MKPGGLIFMPDPTPELLDEMADLAVHWRRNREAGRIPKGVQAGMVLLAKEIIAQEEHGFELQQKAEMEMVSKAYGIPAYVLRGGVDPDK